MIVIKMPKYIDDPVFFLFWRFDNIAVFISLLVVGILFNQVFICLLLGIVCSWIYSKISDSKQKGYLLHYLYWLGILPFTSKTLADPFIKRYIN